jgi:beta-glucosidase
LINVRVREQPPDLVFIGDSITEGWEQAGSRVWAASYGERNAANLGISGDRTQHVIRRLQNGNVRDISPRLAVLMIGTNNSEDDTPEQIADGITAIVHELRARLPTTRILLLAIFPRGPDDQDQRRRTNDRVNALISALADVPMVSFLDINREFLSPDGTLDPDVMPDLLHLSEAGYAIWAEAMEPELQRLLDP